MDEEIINEPTDDQEVIDPNAQTEDSEQGTFNYMYPIYDQSNNLIEDPDLELGYLKKESFTIHHSSIPEKWHYAVTLFEFSNGEKYKPISNNDPHVRVIDDQQGIFEYVSLDGEEIVTVVGQTIAPVLDNPLIPAWDETQTIFRYVLYTEKELADKDFLANGPALLAEARETIDDLLLVIADLLGGEGEEI